LIASLFIDDRGNLDCAAEYEGVIHADLLIIAIGGVVEENGINASATVLGGLEHASVHESEVSHAVKHG
jgi:hypothetical protein